MIKITGLKLPPDHTDDALCEQIRKALRLKQDVPFSYEILHRSLDARKKPDLFYVYTVEVQVQGEKKLLRGLSKQKQVTKSDRVTFSFPYSFSASKESVHPGNRQPRPVVAGSGPAGLFCALMLARAGLKPIVLERGSAVEERTKAVTSFWETGVLDEQTNVQFGEGGAGTFSDGKLNTSIKDPSGRVRFVLQTFVSHGADPEILYDYKPHIGTDVLADVVKSIRQEIVALGGEYRFDTQLVGISFFEKAGLNDHHVNAIPIASADVEAEAPIPSGRYLLTLKNHRTGQISELPAHDVVLAIGHSARDTFELLRSFGLSMQQKSFAIGVRVQHPQEWIDTAMYGMGHPYGLHAAPYKLTHRAKDGRGVYSFCMCPGGYVVNASSEKGHLAVNGMSYHDRAGANANSAIVVTVGPEVYDPEETGDVLKGISFQRELEKKAYEAGAGKLVLQTFQAFQQEGSFCQKDTITQEVAHPVTPQVRGQYTFGSVRSIFPADLAEDIEEGILAFERQIPGFSSGDALLAGVESRTSSPLRILRMEDGQAPDFPGIFPCGEGAGYAGGITSAAVDGIRIAQLLCARLSIDFPQD